MKRKENGKTGVASRKDTIWLIWAWLGREEGWRIVDMVPDDLGHHRMGDGHLLIDGKMIKWSRCRRYPARAVRLTLELPPG